MSAAPGPIPAYHIVDVRGAMDVAVATDVAGYGQSPYSPGQAWPEYPFPRETLGPANPAYEAVRSALRLLGLDRAHYGTPAWNPLGGYVEPGDTVVLKPNFVRDFRESSPDPADCVITHGAILRAVADYVYIALRGRGRVIIADAPQNDADFDRVRELTGLAALQAFYTQHAAVPLEVYDLRPERADKIDGVIIGHTRLAGDPAGYVRVNLGPLSAFDEINELCHLLYGSEYDTRELYRHQHGDTHEYLISGTILRADAVISLPKLKTHKKVGLTVNLKNLVGINGNKNWLPHHRQGTLAQGGDEFADDGFKRRLERVLVPQFKRWFPHLGSLRRIAAGPLKASGRAFFGDTNRDTIRSGNWWGNDTTWRTVVDLNRILLYADAEGRLHEQPVRRFFSLVDGIVAGEGNGPLDPTPRTAGVVLAGGNPLAVDMTCARLAGFDYERMPMLKRAFEPHTLPLAQFEPGDICVRSDRADCDGRLTEMRANLKFAPHFGWRGRIELGREELERAAAGAGAQP